MNISLSQRLALPVGLIAALATTGCSTTPDASRRTSDVNLDGLRLEPAPLATPAAHTPRAGLNLDADLPEIQDPVIIDENGNVGGSTGSNPGGGMQDPGTSGGGGFDDGGFDDGGFELVDPHPSTRILISGAFGEADLETQGLNNDNNINNLDFDGEAGLGRFRAEYFGEREIGFGVDLQLYQASEMEFSRGNDATLFTTVADNDVTDLFVHFGFRTTVDDVFRMPVRIGWWYHDFETTYDDPTVPGEDILTRETNGLRLSAEPEFILDWTKEEEVTLFADVAVGLGPGSSELESTDGLGGSSTEDYETFSSSFNADVGFRFRSENFVLGIGVAYRYYDSGRAETDPLTNGGGASGVLFGNDTSFIGGFIELGTVF